MHTATDKLNLYASSLGAAVVVSSNMLRFNEPAGFDLAFANGTRQTAKTFERAKQLIQVSTLPWCSCPIGICRQQTEQRCKNVRQSHQ